MTSFIIGAHANRPPSSWTHDPECSFCRIIRKDLPSHCVFENDKVIAILDILPLRRGHTLVIPKAHYSRLSELPPEFAAAIGEAVTRVAHALTRALENTALNVVCNQEYAQAVPHVHYHIIPAPNFGPTSSSTEDSSGLLARNDHKPPSTRGEMHQIEFESREELDDGDAAVLVKQILFRL